MRHARFGLNLALLALFGVALISLGGCSSVVGGCCPDDIRSLPQDLPATPDPTKKYCKVWVPPVYRNVPRLVKADCGCTTREEITVMEVSARDVCVKPAERRTGQTCGTDCDDSLVQIKTGGYRWEHDGTCWQYKYRCPQYKWCKKNVREDGIDYCYETPAEYKTIVESTPVERQRVKYTPPKYEMKYKKEIFRPGHWEWRAHAASECTPDRRKWTAPQKMGTPAGTR